MVAGVSRWLCVSGRQAGGGRVEWGVVVRTERPAGWSQNWCRGVRGFWTQSLVCPLINLATPAGQRTTWTRALTYAKIVVCFFNIVVGGMVYTA